MKKFLMALVLSAICFAQPAFALSEQEELIDKSKTAAEGMFSDPNYPTLLSLATKAKAILIVPNMIRGAFLIGGRGGTGVLLARTVDGGWTSPAFYTIGGISYGLQIGAQSSQLIIVIMTDKGLEAIMNKKVTLGADANVAIGEIGAGAQASTGMDTRADMYAFSKSSGVFAGVALDGTVLEPRANYNTEFYGPGVNAKKILVDQTVSDPRAQALVDAMPR